MSRSAGIHCITTYVIIGPLCYLVDIPILLSEEYYSIFGITSITAAILGIDLYVVGPCYLVDLVSHLSSTDVLKQGRR